MSFFTAGRKLHWVLVVAAAVSWIGCAAANPHAGEDRPFFQTEYETQTHGKKSWLDDLIELDPGKLEVKTADDYLEHSPAVVAVLPFCDEGSANFTVDRIPITFRGPREQAHWAWTDSQRLRRAVVGFLAQREFTVINPIAVDAVLKQRGIDTMKKLRAADPIELGRLLGADAVLYGELNSYEGYYLALLSAYHVGVDLWMVSTRDGETLMTADGDRYSMDLSPAFSPQDIAVNSLMTILEFRDVTLARAEDEVSRELVLRIPRSEKLRTEMARRALEHAEQAEEARSTPAEPAVPQPPITPAVFIPQSPARQISRLQIDAPDVTPGLGLWSEAPGVTAQSRRITHERVASTPGLRYSFPRERIAGRGDRDRGRRRTRLDPAWRYTLARTRRRCRRRAARCFDPVVCPRSSDLCGSDSGRGRRCTGQLADLLPALDGNRTRRGRPGPFPRTASRRGGGGRTRGTGVDRNDIAKGDARARL